MPLSTLPNGMVVETQSDAEAAFLYHEIFDQLAYLKHGLEIGDGACVFDVGANVGLFSASLAERYRNLRLVLFEPMPETFAMLGRNAERLLGDARVTLVNAAVASAPGTTSFEFDPTWTLAAGAAPARRAMEAGHRSARRRAGLLAWNRAALAEAERAGMISAAAARRLDTALGNPLLRPFTFAGIWLFFALAGWKARRNRQRVACEVTTVSAAMRTYDIDRIDLLKVDVEGAEYEVLEGIEDADWPRIRQVALEVHVDGDEHRVRSFLEGKGFDVAVEEDDRRLLELMGMRLVYARR